MITSDNDLVDLSNWRFDQFIELGFTDEEAAFLTESGCDYHEARKLIEFGCPWDIAIHLLEPL